ncbi:type I polyketide synthase [Amycolatopsis sp. NPDC001319]|uniref:type I polyketide synthase n=1 Tax=unclassified Amycolatopsis TaxID=2618356 RepID=UPI0036B5B63F
MPNEDETAELVAVIGMAARFPGADTLEEFWALLSEGRHGVRDISEQEFLDAGGDPADLADPELVRKAAILPDHDRFDAAFFGYGPAEAELIDPQQRVLLETAYHALEDAGYADGHGDHVVGVYAGAGDSRYYADNVHPRFAGEPNSVGLAHTATANSLGTLATRLSYDLALTGPSVSLNTACSTALVAVHTAGEALAAYACDIAVVGAVSIDPQALRGYRHVPDGPYSPDGFCRPFSADAAGTAAGDGAGVLVLRRLADALADGDRIRAVLRGSAINNDGRRKVGFSAPSPAGQSEVIVAAQVAAGIEADTVTYVEAHGTATRLGDPIEVAALTEAFRETTDRSQYCALGSVKSNIGHLGAAAGIGGLVKTVLALENETIPPTLHHAAPNPLIDFASTPFRVPTEPEPWKSDGPRRAAVSAFGVGGTNAHVILEEAPPRAERPAPPSDEWTVLPVSGRTRDGLEGQLRRLGRHFETHPELSVAEVARALRARRSGAHRWAVAARTAADAATALTAAVVPETARPVGEEPPEVAFLLPGGGTQYVGMGAELYREDRAYREAVDRCAAILQPVLGHDIRTTLHDEADPFSVESFLALAVVEYALAASLMASGVRPSALLGHSLGEYVAACLSGVMTLEEMLPLLATRVRLMISAGGATVSVALSEQDTAPLLDERLSLTAVNSPASCTVAGPADAVDALVERLVADGVTHRRMRLPAAAHSAVLDPVLDDLAAAFRGVALRPPRIPYVTNVTGTWVTAEQATSVEHWVAHTRRTVRFADGVETLRAGTDPVLVEIGPGDVLSRLAAAVGDGRPARATVPTMRHARATGPDARVRTEALARLWSAGAAVDIGAVPDEPVSRAALPDLPGYAFARDRHWIDSPAVRALGTTNPEPRENVRDTASRRTPRPALPVPHVPPGTDLERAVTAEWEAVLGVDGIGLDDNFFDLGGDSMRAVLLGGRMRNAGVLDVPAAALLATPTIAGLLDRTGRGGAVGQEAFAPVLPMREGGDLPPLFCVHPVSGVAWRYAGLLPNLDPRRPVYGLQALGLDGTRAAAADAGEVLRDALERIRELQPHGPYHLLGWSFGGAVAHRLATALEDAGEEVALLAMLDTPQPDVGALDGQAVEAQAAALVLRLAGLDVPAPATVDESLALLDSSHRDPDAVPGTLTRDEAIAVAKVVRNNLRIAPELVPDRLRGDVLFVSATEVGADEPEVAGGPADRAAAWRPFAGGVFEEVPLACSHYALTDSGPIARIAEALEAHLRRTGR